MYYIYILFSEIADRYYVGHSQDPWKRILEHNENTSDKYTGKYSDWKLLAAFECSENLDETIVIEKFINKQKTKKLVQKLIDTSFVPSGNLALLVRVSKK